VKGVVDKINAAGGTAELFVYPGEGHAFMNAGEDILKRMKSAGPLTFLFVMSKTKCGLLIFSLWLAKD
jgi:hypothetical protein